MHFTCSIEMLTVVVDPFLEAMHMERRDDDFLDKLNHKMSTTVMFILVFIQTFYQVSEKAVFGISQLFICLRHGKSPLELYTR